LGLRGGGDPYTDGPSLHVPTYEQMFRTFSLALPQLHLRGDAFSDERALLDEIRAGHVYSTVDAFAAPARLDFSGSSGGRRAVGGDWLPPTGAVTQTIETNAPRDAEIHLVKNGAVVATAHGATLTHRTGGDAAVYRVEVQLAGVPGDPPAPWILSNPIYVRSRDVETAAQARPPATSVAVQYANGPARGWHIENSPQSSGTLDVVGALNGTQLLVRYALGGAAADSPFVGVVMPTGPAIGSYDRVTFSAHADHPMRLSVQLRLPRGPAGERWQRSVYFDEAVREITVFFADMTPAGLTTESRPVLADVRSLMFVVDGTNTKPGTAGQFWIDDVRYGR
jgi:hypothetical protein